MAIEIDPFRFQQDDRVGTGQKKLIRLDSTSIDAEGYCTPKDTIHREPTEFSDSSSVQAAPKPRTADEEQIPFEQIWGQRRLDEATMQIKNPELPNPHNRQGYEQESNPL